MKIAVCIHGLYRAHVQPSPSELNNRFKNLFPEADFYYHTWDEYSNDVPLQYQLDDKHFFTDPEPILDYHPVNDSKTDCKHGKFKSYKDKNIMVNKTQNANKQIIGYALMCKQITEPYDIMIRARWDTAIDTKVDFTQYVEMAYNDGPVGFSSRSNRGPNGRDGTVEMIDKVNVDINDDWYGYLQDALIIHRRDHFDPDYVLQLHKEKNLWPCEWGWYQVLSLNHGDDFHTSFHGGAYLAR